jgi:hypothetical protein
LYKEQAFDIGEMKHECETNIGTTSLNTKQKRIKPIEKLSIVVELMKVIFLGCIHDSIWALDAYEKTWAKKHNSYNVEEIRLDSHQRTFGEGVDLQL